jgi:hypothetical protein
MPTEIDDLASSYGTKRTKGGWSQSGTLTTGENNAAQPGAFVNAVSLQADFPDCDVYSVQINTKPPSVPLGTLPLIFLCGAKIEWAVEGNTITRVVTFLRGITISGVGQAVKVTAFDGTPPALITTPTKYDVSITVSKGLRPDVTHPPTVWDETVSVAGGGVLVISPIDTTQTGFGEISVEVVGAKTVAADPAPNLVVQCFAGGVAGTLLKAWNPDTRPGFVPLPPMTDTIQVQNFNGAGHTQVTVTLGIDG